MWGRLILAGEIWVRRVRAASMWVWSMLGMARDCNQRRRRRVRRAGWRVFKAGVIWRRPSGVKGVWV